MFTNYSTKNSSYSHLSVFECDEISVYFKKGKKSTENARLLGCYRSKISRKIKRDSITQIQDKNGTLHYSTVYFPDIGPRVYKLNSISTFVQTYKKEQPLELITSTKTAYRYIKDDLVAVRLIDLPKILNNGINETFNDLLRELLPKGVALNSLTTEDFNH